MLDIGALVAGTKYRGEFEGRLKSILDEASDLMNNIILFIDEIHSIIGAGGSSGSDDMSQMIKPLLARGKIKLIGATTFDEYQKHIEKDQALKRRFQELMINEPDSQTTFEILSGLKKHFEEYHGVNINDEALERSIHLSRRYILNRHLPDKAIDILDEACARKSTMNEKLNNDDEYKQFEAKLTALGAAIEDAIERQDYFAAAELKQKEDEIKHQINNLRTTKNLPAHLRPTIGTHEIGKVMADKL